MTVVLPPSQAPRFRGCCYFCGGKRAVGHIAVRVHRLGTRSERAMHGAAPRRVRIPACTGCRMRRAMVWVAGAAFLSAVLLFGLVCSKPDSPMALWPVPWLAHPRWLPVAAVVVTGAFLLSALIWVRRTMQMSFDARGLYSP